MNELLIYIGKLLSFVFKSLNLGNGSTWPGHVALSVNPKFISDAFRKNDIKIIFVIGTNGKTTTSSLVKSILETAGMRVMHNISGANLLNGVASTVVLSSNLFGKLSYDFAIFEIDENAFPLVAKEIKPDYIVALNLFRDQLDRYGEVNTIAYKWRETLSKIPHSTVLLLNADDPVIAYLGKDAKQKTMYFGLSEKNTNLKPDHTADSLHCPLCGTKLEYEQVFFSHLGVWECAECKFTHPKLDQSNYETYPLDGIYNKYNIHSAVLLAKELRIQKEDISKAVSNFRPAFGRGENIKYEDKNIKMFLSKNPTGFNQVIETVSTLKAKTILLALNDRIADGQDVSWIWDVDFEKLCQFAENIIITGDRAYDMAIRIKYTLKNPTDNSLFHVEPEYASAITKALSLLGKAETLYLLPTYTAMLDLRKILSGKKIL